MKGITAPLVSTLCFLPALALDPPASITNARVEVRAGTTPKAAIDRAARDKSATWVGWSVPGVREADMCCFTSSFTRRGCSLGERETSWGSSDDNRGAVTPEMHVFAEMKGGEPHRVLFLSAACPVDGADRRLVWLGPVDPGASLSALEGMVETADRDKAGEGALLAIVHHGDARADAYLEKRALDRSLPHHDREQAVFWAGQTRGDAGYRLLDRVLTSEPDDDLRENAVFSLSQSSVPQAVDRIKRVAVEDREPDVRAHALFSLSQTDADVGAWIVGRLDDERNDRVREQAVFALSQLDDGTDWLLKVLRSKRDPETVRRALFWLGQSDDPRALAEIEKILDR